MSAPRDYPEFLKDMLLEAQLAQQFVSVVEYESFITNPQKQRAVIRSIEVIGEAARNIPKPIRRRYSQINWDELTGMQDRLIYGYRGVDLKTVWDRVKQNLPTLQEKIEAILGEIDSSD